MSHPHGLNGEVYLRFHSKEADWLQPKVVLRLVSKSMTQDYDVEACTVHRSGWRVRLSGIQHRNQSEILKGAKVYISIENLKAAEGEPIFLAEILGWRVCTNEWGVVGEISGFSSNGPQDLLSVNRPGIKDAILIPFVEDFIVELNYESRTVWMSLPEGLLELDKE